MKKGLIILLAIVMIAALVACGAKENEPTDPTDANVEQTSEVTTEEVTEESTEAVAEEDEPSIFTTVEAKDCFNNAGFVELIDGATDAAEFIFASEDSDAVEWSVYVFDEAFEDGFRYIKQAAEPVLVGDGTVSVEVGQYVYVYCSVNEFTADAADENARVNVLVK